MVQFSEAMSPLPLSFFLFSFPHGWRYDFFDFRAPTKWETIKSSVALPLGI